MEKGKMLADQEYKERLQAQGEQYEPHLESIVADLESRFHAGGTFDTFCIPTGEEFVELLSGGILSTDYNSRIPCKCSSPSVAVQTFQDALERYVGGRPTGVVSWHTKPELQSIVQIYKDEDNVEHADEWWLVYSRLLIHGQ